MQHALKYMIFIDATNFLVELSKEIEVEFRAEKPPEAALKFARLFMDDILHHVKGEVIRQYWIGSFMGSEQERTNLSQFLRELDFEPLLLKKKKGKEKGVDILLTKEMLVNAFNQNYDIGYLMAGDEDYLSLIMEVKRYGVRIYGAFFEHGLSSELKIAFDKFRTLHKHQLIAKQWNELVEEIRKELKVAKDQNPIPNKLSRQ